MHKQMEINSTLIANVTRGASLYANAHAFLQAYPEWAAAQAEAQIRGVQQKASQEIFNAGGNALLIGIITNKATAELKEIKAKIDSRYPLYERALAYDDLQMRIPTPENLQILLNLVAELKA